MSKWTCLCRKALALGVACGLASIVFLGSEARAGILQITISEGATSYVILDEGPLDTLVAPPPDNINKIQALAAALVFPDYKVIGLNASTNNPGDSVAGAVLTMGGEVQRITSGTAPALNIQVTDTDYTVPPGGKLESTASNTFTNAPAGDSRTFVSYYNPSNAPYATDISQGAPVPLSFTSSGLGLNSPGGTAAPIGVPSSSLYGLTNITNITLSANGADLVFGGSTKILAIPEPTSVVMLSMGIPLAFLIMLRTKRRA